MPRLPAGYFKVTRRNKDGSTREYVATRFFKVDETGRRKRIYLYGSTVDEVRAKRQKVDLRVVRSFIAGEQRFGAFLDQWLAETSRARLWTPRTLELNTFLINKHVKPALGAVQFSKLSRDQLAAYWSALHVGSRTRQQVFHVLKPAFDSALEQGYISTNPVGRAPKHRYREFRALTQQESVRLLSAARNTRHFCLVYVALVTGMRECELFGLRWEHVNFDHRFLSVSGKLRRIDGAVEFGPSKRNRFRRIDLTRRDIDILARYRQSRGELGASPWVFTDTEGNQLQRHNFRNRDWAALLKAAGIGRVRFYDLRHTFATLALAAGVPVKVVQERMGHASAKMTLDVYAKVVPTLQAKAAEQMSDMFEEGCTSWCTPAGGEAKNSVK